MSEKQANHDVIPKMQSELVTLDECRLTFQGQPTWEDMVRQVKILDPIGRNVAWWWGDLLNYAENLFGDKWTQLIPDIGWDVKTLQNWKWVCEQVRPAIRYPMLAFSVHAEVARLDPVDQDVWLERCAEGGWTVSRLREELRGPKKEKEPRIFSWMCKHCGMESKISEDELKGGD